MTSSLRLLQVLCAVALVFATVPIAFAEDAEEAAEEAMEDEGDYDDLHPLTDMPESSPDVICSGVFPNNPGNRLPLSDVVDAMVGLVNEGQEPINVTRVMGSLNSPFDFNYYIQNFTEQQFNTIIHEDEEYTFRYRFRPIDTLDPVEYHIALTVFYENDEELFSHTFFNDTVTFYEPKSMFDSGNILKLLLGCAIGAAILYGGSMAMGSGMAGGGSKNSSEWVSSKNGGGSSRTQVKRRKTPGKGKNQKKRN